MNNFQKIKIDSHEYFIVDSIQNLRAEDSFIFRKNKLTMFKGNGESRKYVGSYTGSNGERLSDFFEYKDWGKGRENGKRIYTKIQEKCFFSKTNLLKYLYDARIEYQRQEQVYKFDISEFYNEHVEKINALESDKVFFSIYDVSDFLDNKLSRGYIRSDVTIYHPAKNSGVWPLNTSLSCLKDVGFILSRRGDKAKYAGMALTPKHPATFCLVLMGLKSLSAKLLVKGTSWWKAKASTASWANMTGS